MSSSSPSIYPIAWSFSLFLILSKVAAFQETIIEEEALCPDGRKGVVKYIQEYLEKPFQPAIFMVDCAQRETNRTASLRDRTVVPRSKRGTCIELGICSNSCYGSGTSPAVGDCGELVAYLQNRGQQQDVGSMQKIVATCKSCLFRFTNGAYTSETLCDSDWASQSSSMGGQCLPQTTGALCSAAGFTLDVCLNPDTPEPSSTTQTVAVPDSVSGSTGISSTSSQSTSQSDAGGSTSSQSISNQATSSQAALSNASPASIAAIGNAVTLSNTNRDISTSTAGTASSTTVFTTHSVSGTAVVSGIIVPVAPNSPSASIIISQGIGNSSSVEGRLNIPAIIGGILGAMAIILMIIAIWIWRRRFKSEEYINRVNSGVDSDQSRNYQPRSNTALSSEATMRDRSTMPIAARYGTTKLGGLQHATAPLTEHSSSSRNHLLSPTQRSVSTASTPSTSSNGADDSEYANSHPAYGARGRSISARSLAQALAPNLSQGDIDRLADTIIARMQSGAPFVTPQGEILLSGLSDLGEDPPPPWRASWNGIDTRKQPN